MIIQVQPWGDTVKFIIGTDLNDKEAQYATQGHREEQSGQETQDRKDRFRSEPLLVFPGGKARRREFDPWVGEIPWKRKWQPTPVFLPGKSHEQRSLAGYNP